MNMYLFAREGKDRYIDFLKGISIISVVFLHNVPFSLGYYIGFPFTLSQAVPIFLLVQVVNTYRSYLNHNQNLNIYFCWRNIKKMLRRIVLPFICMIVIQLLLILIISPKNINNIFIYILKSGGLGPGAYYPYIYLEFWLILPFFFILDSKMKEGTSIFFFIFISAFLEFVCSSLHLNGDGLYRLLFFRYVFLIFLGIQIFREPFYLSRTRLVLSILGIIFIIIDTYLELNLEPVFFRTVWTGCHWPAFFYTAYLLLFMLKKLFGFLKSYRISSIIETFGRKSYSIFLTQMFVFWLLNGKPLSYPLFFLMTTLLSLGLPFLILFF